MSPKTDLTCAEFRERLPLFVGGDLEAEAQSQTTSHLARCEACGEAWRGAVAAREALLSLRGDVTGEGVDLWGGIRTALRAAETETTRPAEGRLLAGPGFRSWGKGLAAAAAAVVLGVVWWADLDAPEDPPTPASVPKLADTTSGDVGTKLADALPGFVDSESDAGLGALRKRELGEERLGDDARYWTRELPIRGGQGNPGLTPVSSSRTTNR